MKLALGILTALSLVAAIGCEGNIATAPSTEMASTGPPPPAPPPPGGGDTQNADNPEEATAAEPAAEAESDAAEPAAGAETPPAGTEVGATEKAQVGVGVKGKDYGGPGFITTPIQEYFRTGERIAFEIQIPSAMKIYKAEHNDKGPKTHEEFMNIIIKENGVQLPDLAAGEEYLYDPKTEALLVKHPVK